MKEISDETKVKILTILYFLRPLWSLIFALAAMALASLILYILMVIPELWRNIIVLTTLGIVTIIVLINFIKKAFEFIKDCYEDAKNDAELRIYNPNKYKEKREREKRERESRLW